MEKRLNSQWLVVRSAPVAGLNTRGMDRSSFIGKESFAATGAGGGSQEQDILCTQTAIKVLA